MSEEQENLNEDEEVQETEEEPELRSNGRPAKPRVPLGCWRCHRGDRGLNSTQKRDYPKGRF